MTDNEEYQISPLAGLQGPAPYDHDELAALRRRAWREQGLLIVSPTDRKLTQSETVELIRLAERLYGGSKS